MNTFSVFILKYCFPPTHINETGNYYLLTKVYFYIYYVVASLNESPKVENVQMI